jgi:hypothetical protein
MDNECSQQCASGCCAGKLDHMGGENEGGEGTADCDGAVWYTSEKNTSHTLIWKSPACCEFTGTEVQFFVTAAKADDDYLRQQQLSVPGELSSCVCTNSAPLPVQLCWLFGCTWRHGTTS